jgi:hypothetical protein
MTLPKSNCTLSQEELNELAALKDAITYAPQTVSPNKMEKFAELMVRALDSQCEIPR